MLKVAPVQLRERGAGIGGTIEKECRQQIRGEEYRRRRGRTSAAEQRGRASASERECRNRTEKKSAGIGGEILEEKYRQQIRGERRENGGNAGSRSEGERRENGGGASASY